jgi:hypothetical protein
MNAYAFPTSFTIRIGRKIGNVGFGSLAALMVQFSLMSGFGSKPDVPLVLN